MKSGVLLIDKPSGISSAHVLRLLKKRFVELGCKEIPKLGHAGTLDPLASGLLVVLVGRATRLAQYAVEGQKVYQGELLLGTTTTTDDLEGEVLQQSPVQLTDDQVVAAALGFEGGYSQVPPRFSACKINGERAYKRAREGEEFEIAARDVLLSSIQIWKKAESRWSFSVHCSAGTYIRSLARDIGAKLGCGACLTALRRERVEPFSLEDAVTIENVSCDTIQSVKNLFPKAVEISFAAEWCSKLASGEQRYLGEWLKSHSLPPQAERVLYRNASSGALSGLLIRREPGWGLGLSFEGV